MTNDCNILPIFNYCYNKETSKYELMYNYNEDGNIFEGFKELDNFGDIIKIILDK